MCVRLYRVDVFDASYQHHKVSGLPHSHIRMSDGTQLLQSISRQLHQGPPILVARLEGWQGCIKDEERKGSSIILSGQRCTSQQIECTHAFGAISDLPYTISRRDSWYALANGEGEGDAGRIENSGSDGLEVIHCTRWRIANESGQVVLPLS